MNGHAPEYNLSVISEEEFTTFHHFVQSVFDQGRQRFNPKLMQISNNWADMPKVHHEYLQKSDSLGVCMAQVGMEEKEVHIWITPSYKQPMFKFYMTLAHELCHAYVGMKYGHNSHWRRWFYRVLWHLQEAQLIPRPEDELKWVGISVEYSYNYTADTLKIDPMLTVLEAFNKAEQEHDTVLNNFMKRLANA